MKTALICGVSGQDGAYLAKLLLEKGYRVVGTSRDAQVSSFSNLQRLGLRDAVECSSMVLTDFRSTLQTLVRVRPDEVYDLAGQSSVGLSFEQPVEAMESISLGMLNLLEVIRFMGEPIRVYNASSSECYGETGADGANETTPFHPRSPMPWPRLRATGLLSIIGNPTGSPQTASSPTTSRRSGPSAS